LVLDEGLYESQVYQNEQVIVSPTFNQIKLTAAQILNLEEF